MKTNFILLFAFLASFCNSSAQAGATGPKLFHPYMNLNVSSNVTTPMGTSKVLNGDLYVTGVFTSINAQYFNGQTIGYNGIIRFPNCDLRNPQPVAGGGISSPSEKGVHDIEWAQGTEWVVADDYSNDKLFKHEANAWIPQGVTVDSGKTIRFSPKISDSTLLLLGTMEYCKNVHVNNGCIYNLNTGSVTPLPGGGFGTYNTPWHVYRNGNMLYIGTESGIATYNTTTGAFNKTVIGSPSGRFVGHGDTLYVVVMSDLGNGAADVLYRKIGNSPFEMMCFAEFNTIANINIIGDKIHMYGIYSSVFTADSTQYSGTDLAWDETVSSIVPSGLSTVVGMIDYIELPNGEYMGWQNGTLLTTQSLVSGIEEEATSVLKVYPNPATSLVVVEGLPLNTTVTLTDVTGKLMTSQVTTGDKTVFITSDLARGIYFLNAQGHFTTQKIFLQ